jgi:phosphate-selective porin OprO/OprP
VYNDPDYSSDYKSFKGKNAVGTANHEQVGALVYKTMFNDKLGLWSDIAITKGIEDVAAGIEQSDLLGVDIMPFYNISDSFQVVVQYAGVTSLDNKVDVSMSRYASRNVGKDKVETSHNLLGGFNWYLYGHKLKWQNAVEYNYGKSLAGTGEDYNGYGVTSALRISW